MDSKKISKRIVITVISFGIILCAIFLFNFITKDSTSDSHTSLLTNDSSLSPVVSLPLRLKIPRIGVDASIEYVGINEVGEMNTPDNPDDIAWYNLGPRPGEVGSSVLAGHYGWKNDIPAVFDDLGKLVLGDKIFVIDLQGATTTFIVRETRVYGKDDDASVVFDSKDGKIQLNLITCAGEWSEAENSRSNRLVVFTDRE